MSVTDADIMASLDNVDPFTEPKTSPDPKAEFIDYFEDVEEKTELDPGFYHWRITNLTKVNSAEKGEAYFVNNVCLGNVNNPGDIDCVGTKLNTYISKETGAWKIKLIAKAIGCEKDDRNCFIWTNENVKGRTYKGKVKKTTSKKDPSLIYCNIYDEVVSDDDTEQLNMAFTLT